MNKSNRIFSLILGVVLSVSLMVPVCAIDQIGYRSGETILLSEADATPSTLKIYQNGIPVKKATEAKWVENGFHDKALSLSGAGDYLEFPDERMFRSSVTVASWLKWNGSCDGTKDGAFNQQIFTIYRDNANYVSVNLRAYKDEVRTREDGTTFRIDGVYLEYTLAGATGKHIEDFNYTTGGVTYAIPENQWVHFALTFDDAELTLYINGTKWFSKTIPSGMTDLAANGLRVGASLNNGPTLCGLVDDLVVFPETLPIEYIGALADGCRLDFTDVSEPTRYYPTAPQGAETSEGAEEPNQETEQSGLRIPTFAWYAIGVLALLFVILLIVVNKHSASEEKAAKNESVTEAQKKRLEVSTGGTNISKRPEAVQKPAPAPVKPETVQKPAPAPVKPEAVQKPAPAPVKSEAVQKPAPAPVKPEVVQKPAPAPVKPEVVQKPAPAPVKPEAMQKPVPVSAKMQTPSLKHGRAQVAPSDGGKNTVSIGRHAASAPQKMSRKEKKEMKKYHAKH